MYDVFYQHTPTGLFPHEKQASSIDKAAKLSRTKFFWYLDGGNDYRQFDFTWQPDPWEAHYQHIFATQWQRNGGGIFRSKLTPAGDHYQTIFKAKKIKQMLFLLIMAMLVAVRNWNGYVSWD